MRMRANSVWVVAGADPPGEVGSDRWAERLAAVGVYSGIEQLEHDDCQGEPVLWLFIPTADPALLVFRGQVVGCHLRCAKAGVAPLDAEAVAVEHRDVQRVDVEAEVDRLQINHAVAFPVQGAEYGSQVGSECGFGPKAGRQPCSACLALVEDVLQVPGGVDIQHRHQEADKVSVAVVDDGLGPGNLDVSLSLFLAVRQLGPQVQHRLDFGVVAGVVAAGVIDLRNLARSAADQVDAACTAAVEPPPKAQPAALHNDGSALFELPGATSLS